MLFRIARHEVHTPNTSMRLEIMDVASPLNHPIKDYPLKRSKLIASATPLSMDA